MVRRLEQQGQVGVDGSCLLCNDEKNIRIRHVEVAFVLLDVILLG